MSVFGANIDQFSLFSLSMGDPKTYIDVRKGVAKNIGDEVDVVGINIILDDADVDAVAAKFVVEVRIDVDIDMTDSVAATAYDAVAANDAVVVDVVMVDMPTINSQKILMKIL